MVVLLVSWWKPFLSKVAASENEGREKNSAFIKKNSREDPITTVQQITMSQLSYSNHPCECIYLEANVNLYGIAQPAMKEGKVYYFAYAPGRRMHLQEITAAQPTRGNLLQFPSSG